MRKMRNVYKIFVRKPERKCYSEDLGINERIILGRFTEKLDRKAWAGFFWLRTGTNDRLL
jgi:hypothetical protein